MLKQCWAGRLQKINLFVVVWVIRSSRMSAYQTKGDAIMQINCAVTKTGTKPLAEIFPKKEEGKEEGAKEAAKPEDKKEEKSAEKPKEEKKA